MTAMTTLIVLGGGWPLSLQAAPVSEPETAAAIEQVAVDQTVEVEAPVLTEPVKQIPAIEPGPALMAPVAATQSAIPAESLVLAQVTETAPDVAAEVLPDETPRIERPQFDEELAQPELAPLEPVRAELSIEQREMTLERARATLASTKSASGRFTQRNSDYSIMEGSFALRRPGRVRFDYDDPVPVLIVSDGTTVAMEDSELETVDRVPLSSTPLGLILDDQLDFADSDIEIVSVSEDVGLVSITVRDATGELDGELTMLFDAEAFEFLGWIATDSDLQTTQVSLSEVDINSRIDPRLFRLDDPEDEEDER